MDSPLLAAAPAAVLAPTSNRPTLTKIAGLLAFVLGLVGLGAVVASSRLTGLNNFPVGAKLQKKPTWYRPQSSPFFIFPRV